MEKPRSERRRGSVPDAELAVLKVLWDRGQASIRDITDVLYPGGSVAQYATVQKLLERLRERGYVARRRDGRLNVYVPSVAREELIRMHLHETADRFCDGSLTPLLSQLVGGSLSENDLRTLRELVDRLERREE